MQLQLQLQRLWVYGCVALGLVAVIDIPQHDRSNNRSLHFRVRRGGLNARRFGVSGRGTSIVESSGRIMISLRAFVWILG